MIRLETILNQLNLDIARLEVAAAQPVMPVVQNEDAEANNLIRCEQHYRKHSALRELALMKQDKQAVLCLMVAEPTNKQISEGINKLNLTRCAELSQMQIDLMLSKIQFASDFRMYDKPVSIEPLSHRTKQPMFESFEDIKLGTKIRQQEQISIEDHSLEIVPSAEISVIEPRQLQKYTKPQKTFVEVKKSQRVGCSCLNSL